MIREAVMKALKRAKASTSNLVARVSQVSGTSPPNVASANSFILLDDQTAVYNPKQQPASYCWGVLVMWGAAIALSVLIVLAFVLWLRPWVDEYSEPYD